MLGPAAQLQRFPQFRVFLRQIVFATNPSLLFLDCVCLRLIKLFSLDFTHLPADIIKTELQSPPCTGHPSETAHCRSDGARLPDCSSELSQTYV